jgi:hypothetical protein
MFMFCLIFAVCLVSCDRKDSGNDAGRYVQQTHNPQNPKGSSVSDPNAHTGGDAAPDVLVPGARKFSVGDKFTFDEYKPSERSSEWEVFISRLDSSNNPIERLVVTVGLAKWETVSMQTKAVEIGDLDSNNKLFLVIHSDNANLTQPHYIMLFSGANSTCVSTNSYRNESAIVLEKYLSTVLAQKYWILEKDFHTAHFSSKVDIVHPYWMKTSKNHY